MGAGIGPSRRQGLDEGALPTQKPSGGRIVPTTGMRGGLGRTLLTAFLLLAILPIAVTGGYAARQNRRNVEQEAGSRLVAVAALKGETLRHWVAASTSELASTFLVGEALEHPASDSALAAWWADLQGVVGSNEGQPWLTGVVAFDRQVSSERWALGACTHIGLEALKASIGPPQPDGVKGARLVSQEGASDLWVSPLLVLFMTQPDYTLVFCLDDVAVAGLLQSKLDGMEFGTGETGRTSLISGAGVWPEGRFPPGVWGTAIASGLAEPGYALYQKLNGEAVVGAFYPVPEYGMGVLVEQAQSDVLAGTERVAATLIAWVLAVALGTTWIAALVIHNITRPVLDLTESAVAMAEGDLDQRLPVRSRNEIGILTHVFNEMAAELHSLYQELESKVVERTRRLQEANYQIQRRALYLQASQEVSQAITSVRDPEMLLEQVTELVRNHFVYSSVAVYLVDPGGGEARLHACSPGLTEVPEPVLEEILHSRELHWPLRYSAGDGSVVGRALRKGSAQLDSAPAAAQDGWTSRVVSRVAVPLKIAGIGKPNGRVPDMVTGGAELEIPGNGSRAAGLERVGRSNDTFGVVGAIAVVTTAYEGIHRDELEVLEALANQVTIALENARAYERERLAAEQLELAEAFKARFLANMSHELMEPLNTILGFSRLLLKGIDGSLNERQREDVTQIYSDGQHLHALINDILSISELQAGLVELCLQSVDLSELVMGVMPTAGALVRGKDISLSQEIPSDLPQVRGDPARLRQVLVHLLNNAAKFTEAGAITIRAWANDGEVYVSVRDTGVGISMDERPRLFMHFEIGESEANGRHRRGIGLGLSLCREFVELHGGRIWVDSEVGKGSVFTFSVPVHLAV
jgi:signal transduction histidine kinase